VPRDSIRPPPCSLQVMCKQSVPFWVNPDLCPLSAPAPNPNNPNTIETVLDNPNEGDEDEDEDEMEEEEHLYAVTWQTFDKAFDHCIEMMCNFLDAFKHQQQFRNPRFLSQFEQCGASFFC
jgi:hypothetical protein